MGFVMNLLFLSSKNAPEPFKYFSFASRQRALALEGSRESLQENDFGFLVFFVFFCFFLTLQYCIGFAIYQHESATGIHVFPILNPPPSSLHVPTLWVVPEHQPQASSILHLTWTGFLCYTYLLRVSGLSWFFFWLREALHSKVVKFIGLYVVDSVSSLINSFLSWDHKNNLQYFKSFVFQI